MITEQDLLNLERDADDMASIVNGSSTVTTRTGGDKLSVDQALSQIVVGTVATYNPAGTYSNIEDWVEQGGVVYRPLPSQLPIGPEAFDSAKWAVAQGFATADNVTITNNGLARTSVESYLENKEVADYAALRTVLSSGQVADSDTITVTDTGIAGDFVIRQDVAGGNFTDNGGTIITGSGGTTSAGEFHGRRIYTGSPKAIWFISDISADASAELNAAALLYDLDLEDYTYNTSTTFTTANEIHASGAVINHTPTSDDINAVEFTGNNKKHTGTLKVQNLNDQLGDFNTGTAFYFNNVSNVQVSVGFTVESVYNVSRVDSSIGPNGGGGSPRPMVYNAFHFFDSVDCTVHSPEAKAGIYTCFRFNEATRCRYTNVKAEDAYRAAMFAGDDVSEFSTDCHIEGISILKNIKEIPFKVEQGCDDCSFSGLNKWLDCCTIGAGTGGAEGTWIIQGQNFIWYDFVIDCATVTNSTGSEGLVNVGGGSSSDVFGNGFRGRGVVLNAKSSSGNTFPAFGINAVSDFKLDADIQNCYRAVNVSFGDDGEIDIRAKDVDNHGCLLSRATNMFVKFKGTDIGSDGLRSDNAEPGLSNNLTIEAHVLGSNRALYLNRAKNVEARLYAQDSQTVGLFTSACDSINIRGCWDSDSNSGNSNATIASVTLTPTLVDSDGTQTGTTTADGSVTTDAGTGTLYWVVDQSATAPSAAQIKAGQDQGGAVGDASGSQAVSSRGEQSISITGLAPATTYYLYCVQDDTHSNESNVASSPSFTTS